VEVVDSAEVIDSFLAEIDPMIAGGMVTVERVEVRAYRGVPPASP
jgi:PII-like signaling protein